MAWYSRKSDDNVGEAGEADLQRQLQVDNGPANDTGNRSVKWPLYALAPWEVLPVMPLQSGDDQLQRTDSQLLLPFKRRHAPDLYKVVMREGEREHVGGFAGFGLQRQAQCISEHERNAML